MEKKILKDLNDILETKNLKPDTKISKLKFFDSIIYLQIILLHRCVLQSQDL